MPVSVSDGVPTIHGTVESLKRKDVDNEVPKLSKRAAKRLKGGKKHSGDGGEEEHDQDVHINSAIARMDGPMIVDLIARQTKRFEKDLSSVELEERRLPAVSIADTTGWEGDRSIEQLPKFLEQVTGESRKKLQTCSKNKGSPHTLVVTAAAMRAADLTRTLRVYDTDQFTVMKMFAKHIKLKEAIESMGKTSVNIGVGTPQRLIDLVSNGALQLESLRWIVIDASYVDQKRRGILDTNDSLPPVVKFLTTSTLKNKYHKDDVKVIVF